MCSGEGEKQQVPPNHYVPLKTKEALVYGTTYRFQEEDAADGTSFAPSGPDRSTRQFPSSETKCSIINTGTKVHQHDQKEGELTTRLSPSSLRPVSFK